MKHKFKRFRNLPKDTFFYANSTGYAEMWDWPHDYDLEMYTEEEFVDKYGTNALRTIAEYATQ